MTKLTRFTTRAIIMITAVLFIVSGAFAQEESSSDKLKRLGTEIDALSITMTEKAKEYPELIKGIREKRENIENADAQIEKMIADLTTLTDKMDNASEYRIELVAVHEEAKKLVAEVEETEGMEAFVERAKIREQKLGNMDERRAILVAEARGAIRDLRDNQKKLVIIKKLNAIDEAIAILEKGLANFEGIVRDARSIADQVNDVVTGN